MNVAELYVVVVLSMLAVDICHSQSPAAPTCDDLPKLKFPGTAVLSANSPFVYDYSLTSLFDCSTKVFTNPARGDTNYDGTALSVRGSNITTFDYAVGSDGKTIDVTICETGEKSTWYASAYEFNADGGFYCLYTCNGTALAEFACGSNNNGKSSGESEAVKLAKQVPDGDKIHDAKKQNCPARKGCPVF